MKKKLDELNRKIRHSRKKHMIHKRNSLRKAIETLKRGTKPSPGRASPEPEFIFNELEQAFGKAYRSYRVKGEPKMDYDTFFIRVREGLIELISRELNNRNSAEIQTCIWIRFTKDDHVVNLAFNSLIPNNDISVNVLGLEDKEIHILRKGRTHSRGLDLLMISENEINHYTAIKSLSRLLRSSNTKHKCKQYFCMNFLHGFPAEASRDLHRTYCENNEAVRVELPKNEVLEFADGQSQFKVPFVMHYDL